MTTTLVLAFTGAVIAGGGRRLLLNLGHSYYGNGPASWKDVLTFGIIGAVAGGLIGSVIDYEKSRNVRNSNLSIEECVNYSIEEKKPVVVTYTNEKKITSCRPA